MAKGFNKVVRVGLAGAHRSKVHKRDSCSSGGFYKYPSSGATIDSSKPLTVSWDPSCLNATSVDIFLNAPASTSPRIHEWQKVYSPPGSYNVTMYPAWWNSSSTVSLQLAIVATGTEPFLSPYPAGPIFTATYNGTTPPNANSNAATASVTIVNNGPKPPKHGLPGGSIAAAVILPLLFVAALFAGAYIKISREKGAEKRKRWSEAVDKRMSTISTDWKSITPAGAQAAIRNSMVIAGSRASSFSFGAIRPSSTVTVEGGQAGVGARGLYSQSNENIEDFGPVMSQLRPGLRSTAYTERSSRVVSFADSPRPSQDRRTVTSRAFHSGFVPPLPMRHDSGELSPTQTVGAFSLTADDIRDRLSGASSAKPRPSVDEVMPALSMMRNGGSDNFADESLLTPPTPEIIAPPLPTHPSSFQIERSPVMGLMPMQPMPANVMSPDEMLRAYAERRGNGGSGAGTLSPPPASLGGNTMRVLYSPPADHSLVPDPAPYTTNNPFRNSVAPGDAL